MSRYRKWIVIAYDIRDASRLRRLHRYLRSEALPLHYSLFLTQVSVKQMQEVLSQINQIINLKLDDVRVYEVPQRGGLESVGVSLELEEMSLYLDGIKWHDCKYK